MNYVGIDLHKKTIVLCVMDQDRKIRLRRTLTCAQVETIRQTFASLRPFQAVVEATASYHWLVELVEPLADRFVLAHPGKLRVIAESVKKTDRLDAQVLAEFLARDMIPQAYRPTPRQREHRALVRQRHYLQKRSTAVKVKIRRIATDYNADRRDLFSAAGLVHLAGVPLNESDRFVVAQLLEDLTSLQQQQAELKQRLKHFAAQAPTREAEARAVLRTIPRVGTVTVEVVVSELGDISRFSSAKKVCAYAGLVPKVRQSSDKRKELRLTKAGPPLLRWALVQAAWRLVVHSPRWGAIYRGLKKRRGAKKAIVAVARRLLGVMYAMLKEMKPYRLAAT
jgi:transposase